MKKTEIKEVEAIQEVALPSSLDEIVLDTPAKQEYMRMLESYKKQNPKKFATKEQEFIKKMLSK